MFARLSFPILAAVAIAALFILGTSNGLLFNPKPEPAAHGVSVETLAAADAAGAAVAPTAAK